MGSKSDLMEADVLKAITGQATTILTTTPITAYVALYTVTPTDVAASGTEVTGGAYARVTGASKFGTPTGTSPTTCANSAAITFPTATADWGTVVAFALMTASTAGTMLAWGALTTSKSVLNGDTPSFAIGALTLTED